MLMKVLTSGFKLSELLHRNVPGIDAADHRSERERIVAFEISQEHGPPVYSVEGLNHIIIPAGDGRIMLPKQFEEVNDHRGLDAGHIAGRYENHVPACCQRPGMQAADRTDPGPDIGDTAYPVKMPEPRTLLGVAGDKYDLIDNVPERIDETFDERPALYLKKYFSLPLARRASPPTRIIADLMVHPAGISGSLKCARLAIRGSSGAGTSYSLPFLITVPFRRPIPVFLSREMSCILGGEWGGQTRAVHPSGRPGNPRFSSGRAEKVLSLPIDRMHQRQGCELSWYAALFSGKTNRFSLLTDSCYLGGGFSQ